MNTYADFLARKARRDPDTGLKQHPDLPEALFDFQRDIVAWAIRRGRAAIFAQTGLGKSFMELAWGGAIHRATGGNVLLITPLAVAAQMVREAHKFGLQAQQCATQAEVQPGITVTNYAKLHHFDLSQFIGVILDESSILKAFDGKTRTMLTERCAQVPYRLCATATPAPNDFTELGNHAEFLGVMSLTGMQATFFTHDGGDTGKWRLKGHAEDDFWTWMCSWAVMIRRPSDLGYDDGAYALPPLLPTEHIVPVEGPEAVMQLPATKTREGYIGMRDFRGDVVRAYLAAGWVMHSEVCIWKDPVVAQQRTKSIRLLHKQLCKDSTLSGQGLADYVVTFRKLGDNEDAVAGLLESYAGDAVDVSREAYDRQAAEVRAEGREPWPFESWVSIMTWQRYASPVWTDIRQTRTLQYRSARDEKDEQHISPLQLDVIERCVDLWSNPGETVLTPFMGIGSEVFVAVEKGRRGVGFELKASYWRQAVVNLQRQQDELASRFAADLA